MKTEIGEIAGRPPFVYYCVAVWPSPSEAPWCLRFVFARESFQGFAKGEFLEAVIESRPPRRQGERPKAGLRRSVEIEGLAAVLDYRQTEERS